MGDEQFKKATKRMLEERQLGRFLDMVCKFPPEGQVKAINTIIAELQERKEEIFDVNVRQFMNKIFLEEIPLVLQLSAIESIGKGGTADWLALVVQEYKVPEIVKIRAIEVLAEAGIVLPLVSIKNSSSSTTLQDKVKEVMPTALKKAAEKNDNVFGKGTLSEGTVKKPSKRSADPTTADRNQPKTPLKR